MILKKIKIMNYRQLQSVELDIWEMLSYTGLIRKENQSLN